MARRSLFITYLATYLLAIATIIRYLVTLALISAQDHIGFASMQERVDAMGGLLTIDSSPGRGTRVTVEVTSTSEEENDG